MKSYAGLCLIISLLFFSVYTTLSAWSKSALLGVSAAFFFSYLLLLILVRIKEKK